VLHICVFTIGHQFPVHRKSIGKHLLRKVSSLDIIWPQE